METKFQFSFSLKDYDCIGFDLDHTLAKYKNKALIELEYKIISEFLVQKKGYSAKHLLKAIDEAFLQRGVLLDFKKGNLVKLQGDGRIYKAYHGSRQMSGEEIEAVYPNHHWDLGDKFLTEPLGLWDSPFCDLMRPVLDYYDIVNMLIFARAVDSVDEEGAVAGYNIWPDILECNIWMYDPNHFHSNEGLFYPEFQENIDKYLYKCSESTINWLRRLKAKKKLFLLTGSCVGFADATARFTLGEDYKDLFDVVVYMAKKPGFFIKKRKFLSLEGVEQGVLKENCCYMNGNFEGLEELLGRRRMVYIGDNLIQDVVGCPCDSVLVCDELEAEETMERDGEMLGGKIWGSYFKCDEVGSGQSRIMQKYSKCVVPNVEFMSGFPIDYKFCVDSTLLS